MKESTKDRRSCEKELEYRLECHTLLRDMIDLRWKYRDTPAGFQTEGEYEKALRGWEEEDKRLREKGIYSLRSVKPENMQYFTGREKELAGIRSSLKEGRGPVLLYGMGGVGKTTVAAAYAKRYGEEYENVLFLYYDGSIRRLIADDNRVQIREMIYEPERYKSRLRYYRKKMEALRQIMRRQSTLVVLDNCNLSDRERDREIRSFLELPGHILVTGRKRDETLFPVSLEIRPFREKEELEQLQRCYVPGMLTGAEQEELWDYAEKIHYLTLPLVMKMRSLGTGEGGIGWKKDLLEFKKGLLATFHLKKAELLLLMYLAIMPAEGVPLELYLEWSGADTGTLRRFQDALLISCQKEGDQQMMRMHPLIAEAVLKEMPPTAAKCRKLLLNVWKHMKGYDSCDKESVWTRSNRQNQREGPYVFALLRALSGPVPWMAEAYDGLITWLWLMRYDREAEEESLRLYEAVKKYYGPEHQITGMTMIRTAAVYWNTGRREESFPWYERGYQTLKEAPSYNEDYAHQLATAAHKLATNVWMFQRDYEKALSFLDESLKLWKDLGCPDTPKWRDLIWVHAMRSRSHCLMELGRMEEAEQQWQELERMVPDHFRFSANWRIFQDFRARSLEKQGRDREALAITEEMLDGLELYTMGGHVEMIEARELAGDRYMRNGYREKAKEQYGIALDLLNKHTFDFSLTKRIEKKLFGSRT